MRKRLAAVALLAACFVVLTTSSAEEKPLKSKDDDRRDLTLLRRVAESTFIHEASRITFTVPKGWDEIRPQRLTREVTCTALGVELTQRKVVATISWLPMSPATKLEDFIRDKDVLREKDLKGEYGEEHETLVAVYGKENVSTPEKKTYNGRTVYKVTIKGGPDGENKYDGALYAFDVDGVDGKWFIKIRCSYPKARKDEAPTVNDQYAETVINALSDIPTAVRKGDLPKVPDLPKIPELPKPKE